MEAPTYDTPEDIFIGLTDLLEPPERISVSEAAARYRHLNNPGAYIGPWLNDTAPYMTQPMDVLASRDFSGCVFVGPAQSGKALALDTPIATPHGWTTMGDVRVGDRVFADDGKPTKVISVSEHKLGEKCFRVRFDDGSTITTDGEHRWTVRYEVSSREQVTVTTEEMHRGAIGRGTDNSAYSIRNTRPLDAPKRVLPIDPYTLGVWLGAGNTHNSQLTLPEEDIEVAERVRAAGYMVEVRPYLGRAAQIIADVDPYRLVPDTHNTIRRALYDLNLVYGQHRCARIGFKHIPYQFLRASLDQRRELLRGLMDTIGTCRLPDECRLPLATPWLANDVYELLVTLGYKVKRRISRSTPKSEVYWLQFHAFADDPPFHLPRLKQQLVLYGRGERSHTKRRFVEAVDPIDPVMVCCIAVDAPSHLFLAGTQMVPTHNTDAAILNWLAYSIKVDPMDMLIFSPTQSAARDFSMRRIDRLHRHSPAIGALVARNRDADNKFDKHYRSGMILNLSWPTITELAGRPVGRIALTDYDRMDDDIQGDGNPFDLASKRTTTFGSFAMTLAESSPSRPVENMRWIRSTPHEAPPCKGILSLYNRGDRRRWYWPCYSCGSYFRGEFNQFEWDHKATAIQSAETVRLVCPHCGYKHDPGRRFGMNEWGVWLRDGESISKSGRITGDTFRSKTASFWLDGTAAAFTTWVTLISTYLNAMGDFERTGSEEELKKFWTTDMAQPYVPKAAESERLPEVMKARAEALPTREVSDARERIHRDPMLEPLVPEGVRFLIATVDVQKNMFIVQVHGVCPGEPFDIVVVDRFSIRKSVRLDEGGDAAWVKPGTYLEDWEHITREVMERTYALSDGSDRRMQVKLTGCDSGGKEGVTTNAYNYYRALKGSGLSGRFQLVKGDRLASRPRSQITFPDSNRRDKLSVARGDVPVMLLNTNTLKDNLNNRLDSMVPGKGMFRYPDWLPDWWYSEMCAETRTDKGWENLSRYRNEAWDLGYYCLGLCVSVLVRAEHIDWTAPPGWAATWDKNDLVSLDDKKRFASHDDAPIDFAAFGALLG